MYLFIWMYYYESFRMWNGVDKCKALSDNENKKKWKQFKAKAISYLCNWQ